MSKHGHIALPRDEVTKDQSMLLMCREIVL